MGKDFNQLSCNLKNSDSSVRESAFMELGRMCDERTLDSFIVILKNDDEPHNR